MTLIDFLSNVTALVALMAAITLFEAAVPLFHQRDELKGRRLANVGLTAFTFLINWGFLTMAVLLSAVPGPDLLVRTGLPGPVQAIAGIVVLDFFYGYLAHSTMHAIPALWRVHAVHHSDPFVDVTTSYRTHPVEVVWRNVFMLGPVWLLGVSPGVLAVYRMLSAINALLEHANVRVWPVVDRIASLVWVTPHMHKIHHSRERAEANSNYGNILSVFDRGLRTFTPTSRARSVSYGLDDVDQAALGSLPKLLAARLKKRKAV
jgi:sterol desaturase/sphingolipid hydroxylase (fatty acid hydroxylase superfamily)